MLLFSITLIFWSFNFYIVLCFSDSIITIFPVPQYVGTRKLNRTDSHKSSVNVCLCSKRWWLRVDVIVLQTVRFDLGKLMESSRYWIVALMRQLKTWGNNVRSEEDRSWLCMTWFFKYSGNSFIKYNKVRSAKYLWILYCLYLLFF